jgi:hypothetical protein
VTLEVFSPSKRLVAAKIAALEQGSVDMVQSDGGGFGSICIFIHDALIAGQL